MSFKASEKIEIRVDVEVDEKDPLYDAPELGKYPGKLHQGIADYHARKFAEHLVNGSGLGNYLERYLEVKSIRVFEITDDGKEILMMEAELPDREVKKKAYRELLWGMADKAMRMKPGAVVPVSDLIEEK